MTRVLVCGSRDYADYNTVCNTLDRVHGMFGITTVIEGAAKGADRHAADWALSRGRELLTFPADWNKYHRGAGHVRNKQMLEEGKPDVVFAFTNKPLSQSKGTLNMVTQARKAGVKVVVVGEDDTGRFAAAGEYVIQEELFSSKAL